MFHQPHDIYAKNGPWFAEYPIPLWVIVCVFCLGLMWPSSPAFATTPEQKPPSGMALDKNTQKNKENGFAIRENSPRRDYEPPLRAGRYGASPSPGVLSNSRPLPLSNQQQSPSDAVDDLLLGTSISVGSVTHGNLIRGVEMSTKDSAWHFIPAAITRRTNYATRSLINILAESARRIVEEHQGPRLLIGNLSFERGGDLPWSVSHNSGRDADVAFYSTHEDGSPVEHNHFIRFNRRGRGHLNGKTVYFDAARNWHFVRSFLTSEDIQVQWMFLASPLRRKILRHAEKIEEPQDLIARATKILKQPSDSSPHRDHFHIRIYCGLPEVLKGCRNTGATWDWVSDYQTELGEHIEHQEALLVQGGKIEKFEALKNLKLVGHRPSTSLLLDLLNDTRTTPDTQSLALKMALAYGGIPLGSLEALLDHPNEKVRHKVIRELGLARKKRVVPLLIAQFTREERKNRDAIRKAFAQVTNHTFKVPDGDGPAHLRLQRQWTEWYKQNSSDDWEQWIREGFERKGANFHGRMLRKQSLPLLIKFTKHKNHLGLNANRILNRIIGRGMSYKSRSYSSWKSWWRKKHRKYGFRSSRL